MERAKRAGLDLMLCFGLGLAAIGCSSEVTELVVALDSDMSAPGEIDAIDIEIDDTSGGLIAQRTVALSMDGPSLPATFGLVRSGSDADQVEKGSLGFTLESSVDRVRIQVSATLGATRQVTRTAEVSFVGGETRRLDLFLAARCRSEQCAPGQTCDEDGCVDTSIDPNELPPWSG